ncbi:uncharacterized protein BBA_05859 [Beauveria bassiana ARSEF 2860]|uniref:Extracellular membrane protein CFEM domain-containing protein n=1 Tax=Beauveria bassiana (strain ARSEF 2860) TaxID=655819 RepID=J4KN50_BEAB2|nr:uncharacterized protein BBA_05859 [Beauveria bassiana ARSEF 2860]EJP65089.1 hypothetical protein BBA_05859 [Beauveria bassiana ARSEF 2860]
MTRPRGLASRAFPRLLLLFLLAAPSALALDASFEFYPKAAQSCLSKAATSSACSGDTSKELNACLCSNGGQFVEKAIQCLAQENNDVMGDVFTTMDDACTTSGTPLSWKWSDWVDAAKSATSSSSSSTTTTSTETSTTTVTKTSSTTATESTSTTLTTATASSTSSGSSSPSSIATATTTNSPTSSPSPSPGESSSSDLSTTATIGIAAGVSVAGVAAIAALAFFLVRKRKRASQPPMSYSMLTPEKYNGAGGAGAAASYPPHGPSPSNLGGGGGGGGGGAAGGFDSEANETPLYTLPAYVSKLQSKQSYTALSSTSPDSALEQQKKQHNFLSGWEPPTHATQYTGPYAPPQTGPVELPLQMQPVMSNVFELDAHGVGAAPRPAQPALQPIAERQRESRMYRPYMPT